tara:strand:- start:544 stop:657 length:114 start_codon:yes stop_codon:yes gene_type:complete
MRNCIALRGLSPTYRDEWETPLDYTVEMIFDRRQLVK